MSEQPQASSQIPWPPLIFATAFVAGWLGDAFRPMHLVADEAAWWLRIAGGAVVAIGFLVAIAAELKFYRAGTATLPIHPTSAIVEDGIYRYSRNPMYLGMSIILAGLAPTMNNAWYWLALPFAIFAVTKLAIEREEAYLAREFAARYLPYKARVRRWF